MHEKKVPKTLEEAYGLRDADREPEERDLYQEHVYRLREEEYRSRDVRVELSRQKRERGRENGADRAQVRRRHEVSEGEWTKQATMFVLSTVGILALLTVLLWATSSA